MSTNYSKMSTAILKKKLSTAKGDDKAAIKDVLSKREKQVPTGDLKGTVITFTTRSGLKVKGEITSVIEGKKDGKTYYGVRFEDKLYYKQAKDITVVEKKAKKASADVV